MDIDKLLKFVAEYLSEWLKLTVTTLRRPIQYYSLVQSQVPPPPGTAASLEQTTNWLDPRLVSFCAVNIVLGIGLTAALPTSPVATAPPLHISVPTVLFSWVAYATLIHGACRLLGGDGEYVTTLAIVLQVMATIYFVSALASFLVGTGNPFSPVFIQQHLASAPDWLQKLVGSPVWIAFLLSSILQLIYLPLALRPVHRLTSRRMTVLPLISIAYLAAAIYVYLLSGLRMAYEPPRTGIAERAPNPSLKLSANGRPPGPGRRYAVHFRQPGPGVLPLAPA